MGVFKPGINDVTTTDPERSKMFVDQEFAKTVTRGSNKKAIFQCLNDTRHPNWDATVANVVIGGTGCPACRGQRVVVGINDVATTDPERSKMFVDQGVAKMLRRSSNRKAKFRCLDDARHPGWSAAVSSVIVRQSGCPVCAGRIVITGVNDVATTDPERSKMFVNQEFAKTVTRSSTRKATFRCLEDARHQDWETTVASVVVRQSGCAACCGQRVIVGANDVVTTDPERSKMFVDQEFAKTVTRSSTKKAAFQCINDANHPNWESHVYSTIAAGYGCSSCATYSFNPSLPATLYVLDATTHIVFGITGNLERRLKEYDDSRVLLHRFDYDDGGEARRIESAIRREFKKCKYGESALHGELTESLTLDCLADLLTFIASQRE